MGEESMTSLSNATPSFHKPENIPCVRYRTDAAGNKFLVLSPYIDFRASPQSSTVTGATPSLLSRWLGGLARLFQGGGA